MPPFFSLSLPRRVFVICPLIESFSMALVRRVWERERHKSKVHRLVLLRAAPRRPLAPPASPLAPRTARWSAARSSRAQQTVRSPLPRCPTLQSARAPRLLIAQLGSRRARSRSSPLSLVAKRRAAACGFERRRRAGASNRSLAGRRGLGETTGGRRRVGRRSARGLQGGGSAD